MIPITTMIATMAVPIAQPVPKRRDGFEANGWEARLRCSWRKGLAGRSGPGLRQVLAPLALHARSAHPAMVGQPGPEGQRRRGASHRRVGAHPQVLRARRRPSGHPCRGPTTSMSPAPDEGFSWGWPSLSAPVCAPGMRRCHARTEPSRRGYGARAARRGHARTWSRGFQTHGPSTARPRRPRGIAAAARCIGRRRERRERWRHAPLPRPLRGRRLASEGRAAVTAAGGTVRTENAAIGLAECQLHQPRLPPGRAGPGRREGRRPRPVGRPPPGPAWATSSPTSGSRTNGRPLARTAADPPCDRRPAPTRSPATSGTWR